MYILFPLTLNLFQSLRGIRGGFGNSKKKQYHYKEMFQSLRGIRGGFGVTDIIRDICLQASFNP